MIKEETDRFKGYFEEKGINFPYTTICIESDNKLIARLNANGIENEIIAPWRVP